MSKPRIALVGSGGTIASLGGDSLDFCDYSQAGLKLGAKDLVERAAELRSAFEILPVEFDPLSSSHITTQHWLRLNELLHVVALNQPALDGIVVTHGTSTLEETAYFLDLVLKVSVPVVLVGAQRPYNTLSSDGPLNLLQAAQAATSTALVGAGVVVLLNGEIHCAREVTKGSNYRLDAFRTPDIGALGSVEPNGEVKIYRRSARRHMPKTEFDARGRAEMPRVDIAYSHAGADVTAIDAFVAAGAAGIVSAGVAPGIVTPAERKACEEAVRRQVIVIQSSRAGSGDVLLTKELVDRGAVAAGNLNPQKARVLAMVGLSVTRSRSELQRIFDEY